MRLKEQYAKGMNLVRVIIYMLLQTCMTCISPDRVTWEEIVPAATFYAMKTKDKININKFI